jgi:hypothetical protein
MWRVRWPDRGLSGLTNLTRAKAAALKWAECEALTEHRNLSVAQRLKLLGNFSWASLHIAPNELAATEARVSLRRTSDDLWERPHV